VRDIRTLAIAGFAALPRRGVEVGGILFGDTDDDRVLIASFEEAPCEHRYGPSYALSLDDQARLSALLAARRGSALPVVGFFRSFTSRDPVIEEADEAFVREHFPAGDFIFLLLRPLSIENCVAGLRFFRGGELLPEMEDRRFPFDPPRMPMVEGTERKAAPPPSSPVAPEAGPEPEPAPVPTLAAPQQPVRENPPLRPREELVPRNMEPAPRHMRWWIPAAVCLVAGLGGAVMYELGALSREPAWTELRLDARPAAGGIEITWDGGAARAVQATRGLLAVTDGDNRREIPLNLAQIRAGKYEYAPLHADVAVRLTLYANDRGEAGDAVRLAAIPAPAPPRETGPPAEVRAAAPAPETPSAPPQSRPPIAVPPSTVHEVQPRIPAGVRSRIAGRIVIPVEVEVSERGRVVRAVPQSAAGDSVHRYLARQAHQAALQWRFTPARTASGERVAASRTIQFVFTP